MVDHKLDLNDNLGMKDKASTETVTPEQIATVEKQIIAFLLSLRKQLYLAKGITDKLGLKQLGVSLNASAESISVYLKEYEEQKVKTDGKKGYN